MTDFIKFDKNVHLNEGDCIGYLDICYSKNSALYDCFCFSNVKNGEVAKLYEN